MVRTSETESAVSCAHSASASAFAARSRTAALRRESSLIFNRERVWPKLSGRSPAFLVLRAEKMKGEQSQRFFRFLQSQLRFFQRSLGTHSLTDIAGDLGETDQMARRVSQSGDDDVRPEFGTVLTKAPAFVLRASFSNGSFQHALRLARLDVFLGIEGGEMLADDFKRFITL